MQQAERRLGELLKETEKNKGTRLGGNIVLPPDDTPTLEEQGVSKIQSHRWQTIADLPEEDFEQEQPSSVCVP